MNTKGETFCLPCRMGKKVPWWNWGKELKWSVPKAQKGRGGITDPEKVAGTVNQKIVQRREAKNMRQIFKSLREVWMNVGIKKIDTHEGRTVKILLDSGAIKMFMSRSLAEKREYRLIKLKQPIQVRNVDGTGNSGGVITHKVEVNMFYKGHVKRV